MAKSVTLFNVFVASPSDLIEERDLLADVINEINHTTANSLSIKLELLRWETDSFPLFGNDAQDVINNQIEDDYDIFIGIMGGKFGSPTNRFGSGTLEEFNRAYEKFKKDEGKTKIMMYFKNVSLAINEINIDQVKQIQDFKKNVGSKGGLYWEYDKATDFKGLIRTHLNLLLPRLTSEHIQYNSSVSPQKESESYNEDVIVYSDEDVEEVEEVGYLDSLAVIQDYFSDIRNSAGRITANMVEMSNKVNKGTEKINKVVDLPERARIREARKIIDKTADDMMMFVNKTNIEIPIYKDAVTKGFNAYSVAYVNFKSFVSDESELLEIDESKSSLRAAVSNGVTSLSGLKDSIANLPGMTSKLVKARKETVRTLNKLISEFELSLSLLDDIDNKE